MHSSTQRALDDGQYLRTNDLLRLLDMSRSSLEWWIQNNVCSPTRIAGQRDLLWPPNQVQRLLDAKMLLDGGSRREDIKALLDQGRHAVQQKIYEQAMEHNRKSRRETKLATLRGQSEEALEHLGRREGLYVRYLPERWVALAPTLAGFDGIPWRAPFVNAYQQVRNVSHVVGWCTAPEGGCLLSCTDDLDAAPRTWAYCQLASPPMPVCMGSLVIDGGCYHGLDPERGNPDCNRNCAICSRFGHKADGRLTREWARAAEKHPELWDDCLMADDLEAPFTYGPWASYTLEKLDPEAASQREEEQGPPMRRWRENPQEAPVGPLTMRFQRMPLEVPLPMGVSAAVLPAGTYLCKQCVNDSPLASLHRMVTLAELMPSLPLTPELEDELNRKLEDVHPAKRNRRDESPFIEPFARARFKGDPRLRNLVQDVTASDTSQMYVLTNTALRPEDAFSIVCATMPREDDEDARYEIQLLVEASDFLAETHSE